MSTELPSEKGKTEKRTYPEEKNGIEIHSQDNEGEEGVAPGRAAEGRIT